MPDGFFDPSKYGPQMHIWWKENCSTVTIELFWHDFRQWTCLQKLSFCATIKANKDIVFIAKLHNGTCFRRSKQRRWAPANVWHVELHCLQLSSLLNRHLSGMDGSKPKGIHRITCALLAATVHTVLRNHFSVTVNTIGCNYVTYPESAQRQLLTVSDF